MFRGSERRRQAVVVLAVSGAVVTLVAGGWRLSLGDPSVSSRAGTSLSTSAPTEALSAVPKVYAGASRTFPQLSHFGAIAQTLAGMPKVDFASLTVSPPEGRDSSAGLWMHATMNVESQAAGASIPAYWEACLAEGAIAERLAGDASNLGEVLAGVHIQARYPDGSTAEQGGCGGDVAPGGLFAADAENMTDDEIVGSVKSALAEFGLTPNEIKVLHPLGPAVWVVASAASTDSIAGQFNAIQDAILGSPYRYEGLYLEIRGQDGEPLVRAATAFRAGTGSVWFAPGMDNDLGIVHG